MGDIGTAVVGYGFAGRCFHSYLVGLVPELALLGVASRNPRTRERIEAERGCRAYAGFEEVLADPAVSLVVLASPSHLHCEQACRALAAGKHVVTDKPMGRSLAECDRMMAAAARHGRVLSVFQNRRWDGDFLTLQRLREEGRLGAVRWLELAWGRFGKPGGWRGEAAAAGGRLYDLGSHMIDQLCVFFPAPVQAVYARLHHDFGADAVESQAMVVVHFADGCTGVVDASSVAAIAKPRFHAFGSAATFRKYGVDPQEQAMIAGDIDRASEDPGQYGELGSGEGTEVVPTLPGRWRSFYENVAAHLLGEAELAVTPASVRRQMAVLDAAFRSAHAGQVIPVG